MLSQLLSLRDGGNPKERRKKKSLALRNWGGKLEYFFVRRCAPSFEGVDQEMLALPSGPLEIGTLLALLGP